jgi:dipeptidyl aminopeptidase/acylaminoacyl peptidase
MRFRIASLVIACLLLTLARPTLGAADVFLDHVDPHWFADDTKFWYRNDLPGNRRHFIVVDAATGRRADAFDHARVAERLSTLLKEKQSADRLPVHSLLFEKDDSVLLSGAGQSWRLTLKDYDLREATPDAKSLPELSPIPRVIPSRRSSEDVTLLFENRTNAPIELFWIDPNSNRKSFGHVKPGDFYSVTTFVDHVWLVTDKDGKTLGIFRATATPSRALIGGQTRPAADAPSERRPRSRSRQDRSPDGVWSVKLSENNLVLRKKGTDEDIPLTHDGKAGDDYAADRVWWSPDSKYLVAMRTEAGQTHDVFTVESSPKNQIQPKLRTINYLKPGDKINHPRPRLFEVATQRSLPIDENLFPNPWSITEVRWAADSSRFTFLYNQRGHQVLRLISVDAKTGDARAIVDEQSKTFIDYNSKYDCRWIGEDRLVWMSERDGWNHLWLYDAKEGKVLNQITKGRWVVQKILDIDEEKQQILFQAGGVRDGQDPYFPHICRIKFDGSGMTILTEGDGVHTVKWSPDKRFFVDTFSRVDLPPVTQLRSGGDGKLICKLEEANAERALERCGGHWPIRFTAKGRDGVTDIYGVIILPRDFDPAKKYPVVENIYAGPQGYSVPKRFSADSGTRQAIADMGMIVVVIDGMGTSGRSKAFHDVCWRNLKDAGFPDRIAWIKAAAEKYPYMDLSRIGIYGGSAGGQNAMAALLWHHDFYKVAVADCGCHDNRMDKIWWNELWMGWPVGKEYAESSNVDNAHLLEGRLMLMVGEMDSNVDPASTMQVVNALEKANKTFDLVIVTGANHGSAETPYGSKRRAEFLRDNLIRRSSESQ